MTDRIRIRDLEITGGDGNHGLFLQSLEGWNNQTEFRREKNEREQAHGVFPAPGFHDQRLVVIDGECLTDTPEEQNFWAARVSGLLNDGQYGRLTVQHQGTTLWADVGMYSQSWDIDVYGKRALFQLQLLAPDPRRYGETRVYPAVAEGGEVLVSHRGNARAYPRFKVTAAGEIDEGWAVYGPGSGLTRKRFKVNGLIAAGQSNDINLLTGEVSIGNVRRRGVIEDATTWGVPGGAQVSHLLDTNGDGGTLTVSITDTYT